MRRVIGVRQDASWRLLAADDLLALAAANDAAPKVPLPESQVPLSEPVVEIEEVIRQGITDTAAVSINLSASSSMVTSVSAGQTFAAVPAGQMVASSNLQQPSGLLQQPSGLALSNSSRRIFDSMMDREVALSVFEKMLAGAAAPFVGSPDLRSGAMDTSTNPTWLLLGGTMPRRRSQAFTTCRRTPTMATTGSKI